MKTEPVHLSSHPHEAMSYIILMPLQLSFYVIVVKNMIESSQTIAVLSICLHCATE